MTKPRGLGKGLNALIKENNTPGAEQKGVLRVDINKVKPNNNQPRKHFDEEKINELAQSIKEHGVIQPLIVVQEGMQYVIVAGERRFRASKKAGLKEIPVIIREYTGEQVLQIALIENLQREDLGIVETAKAYKELSDNYNMTQEDIASRIGKSRALIANTMRLLTLPSMVLDLLDSGKLSAGHARAVLSLKAEHKQKMFASHIVEKDLSVREAEKLAKRFLSESVKIKPKIEKEKPSHITELEDRMCVALGTKVNINHKNKKGKIEIEYYSIDDLDRIISILE